MALRYSGYAVIALLISSISTTIPVLGAGLEDHNVPPISVQTDSDYYEQGDTVVITGLIKSPQEGIPVTLRILDSNSKLIQIDQFNPASDGSFSKTYIATGPLWKPTGNYTVIAQYGSAQKISSSFSFGGGTGENVVGAVEKKKFPIDMGDLGVFDVEYVIRGGTVKNMKIVPEELSLVITIDAARDGSITVTLPRDMIEAKKPAELTADDKLVGKTIDLKDLEDDEFFVLIGGEETNFKETKSKTTRTLSIGFTADDSEIKIIGTWAVPEFGAIAALVLAVAIISIIVLSAKTRYKIFPRY